MSEANVSAAWPHGDTVIAVNPAKRRALAQALVLAGTVILIAMVMSEPLGAWARKMDRQEEARKHEVAMRKLADAGKPDAIMWLAQHFPETDAGRLDALIRAGSGEAAWTLAGIKAKTDKVESQRLAQVAADNGFLPAMQYAQRPFR